jgi:hypothetical protein
MWALLNSYAFGLVFSLVYKIIIIIIIRIIMIIKDVQRGMLGV